MKHYTTPGVVKTLATRLVAVRVACGQLKITTRRQFRDAVVAAAHAAFLQE
ncbi:MAG: hypothetical protein V4772_07240 [Pseudomonadota bacterium]